MAVNQGGLVMLSNIKYIVKTQSEKERLELIDFILGDKLGFSFTTENESQIIAICPGDVWYLSSCTEEFANSGDYQIFESAEEFIKFYKDQNL